MYIRMINKKAKWEQDKNKNISDISSDIITNCLKTSQDTLSLWYVENEDEIDNAIIALSSNRDYVNRLDYIVIPDQYIKDYNLELNKEEGNSPYISFNNNHYNIVNINYSLLGRIAEMIVDIINNGQKIERIHEKVIKSKLKTAIEKKLLDTQKMKESLLSDIEK